MDTIITIDGKAFKVEYDLHPPEEDIGYHGQILEIVNIDPPEGAEVSEETRRKIVNEVQDEVWYG